MRGLTAARACVMSALLTLARSQSHQVRSDWSLHENDYVMAHVNVTYRDLESGDLYQQAGEIGKYSTGLVSPARGRLVHASSRNGSAHHGCDPDWDGERPPPPWIALVRRGLCNFDVKVENALRNNASAVVIYNYKEEANLPRIQLTERHGDAVVTIFIPKAQGEDLAQLVDSGVEVYMQITPGNHYSYSVTNLNKTSVLFVSVSFILLMVISLAWLLFYYVQRFRYMHAKDRLTKRLMCAARKALSKIPVRVLKAGDAELAEAECCAVCLEAYRAAEHLRILPCSHEFHKLCVDPWLLKNRTCPMCKMDILKYYGLSSISEESIIQLEMEVRDERRSSRLNPTVYITGRPAQNLHASRTSLQSMSLVMTGPCVAGCHSGTTSGAGRRVSSVVSPVGAPPEPPRRLSAPARPAAAGGHEPLERSLSSPARSALADQSSSAGAEGAVCMRPDLSAGSCCGCHGAGPSSGRRRRAGVTSTPSSITSLITSPSASSQPSSQPSSPTPSSPVLSSPSPSPSLSCDSPSPLPTSPTSSASSLAYGTFEPAKAAAGSDGGAASGERPKRADATAIAIEEDTAE